MNILVLGAGLVGGPMARDLGMENNFDVTVADISQPALDKLKRFDNIRTLRRDLSEENGLKKLAAGYDMVVNAVPGFMGFRTVRTLIETGRDVVDIAFFPEDPFQLDELARKNNSTVIVDCGVAPGMSHLLTAYADSLFERTEKVEIYVGGLPVIRQWPYEYKAVFSPIDVIEEYTRPARLVENGRVVEKPALSEAELIDLPGVGTLEAFNSDGLRTLTKTIDAPFMKEKTLRYPGHLEKMRMLRETGFFAEQPVEVGGKLIRPIDMTAKLLFPKWELKEGEHDLTIMRILVEGIKEGKRERICFDLFDRYDEASGVHSMARTTGYTATVMVRLLAAGLYRKPGINPPEFVGRDERCVQFMLDGLKERGVEYIINREELEEA